MEKGKVAVLGASNVDLIAYVPRLPTEGETLKGTKFQQGFGGKGANQAVQAAKLGAKTVFITKIGEDSFGKQFLENFQKLGISTQFVFTDPNESTGLAPIAVDDAGNNSIIIIPGANDLLTEEEILSAKDEIAKSQIFVAQMEIPLAINIYALKLAKSLGVTTVLNTAPAPPEPLPEEIYQYVDILCANQPELQMIAQCTVNNPEDAKIAARKVLSCGVKKVLVTLGKAGCLLVQQDTEPVYVPGEKVEKVVDTSGAGDSFLGTLSYFLANGESIENSVKKANYVASKSVQKKGTQSSYADRSELADNFFA